MTAVVNQTSAKDHQKCCEGADHKCVCEICTCGRHHCPPSHVKFNGQTTNHEDYKAYNIFVQKPHQYAYKINQTHYDPQIMNSTYRANYKPIHCSPNNYHNSTHAYKPNTNKLCCQTQYNKSYVPYHVDSEHPCHCNAQYRPNSAKFDGTTTYGAQFKQKHSQGNAPLYHYSYHQNKLPFYGHTTYGDNFKKYPISIDRPHNCCHHDASTDSKGKFQGNSSYRNDYQGRQNKKCCRCVVEQLPPRPRQCSPGKEHIHFCAHDCKWE